MRNLGAGVLAFAVLMSPLVFIKVLKAQTPPRPPGPPAEVAPVFTSLFANLFSCHIVNAHQDAETGVNTMVYDANGWRHTVYLTNQADGATVLTIYKERSHP